ncbi:hypothetical protein AHF37_04358 [Paragonimus kellicotti]|nr:hypothetical protein AHF37_04358 [Paragonimus kellicotti]
MSFIRQLNYGSLGNTSIAIIRATFDVDVSHFAHCLPASLDNPLFSTNSNNSSSPSRDLDNTKLMSVDVKFTRAVDTYPNQASHLDREIDSSAVSVSEHPTDLSSPLNTTAKDHFKDAHEHSPSESSYCLDCVKPAVGFKEFIIRHVIIMNNKPEGYVTLVESEVAREIRNSEP